MIFDGKTLTEISDDEIRALVEEHVSERQRIEYKVTINYGNDEERIEVLKDIASIANSGGGYIIVGIRDDGDGKAQKFEPELVGNVDRIKKAISSLCQDYISERIEGMEYQIRDIDGNPILIIRVPSSYRKPHMVTINNRTIFTNRHYDGKREMTVGEIKSEFQGDYAFRKISEIETHLGTIMQKLSDISQQDREPIEGEVVQLLRIENGEELHRQAYIKFKQEIDTSPYLWLAIMPKEPSNNILVVDSQEVQDILREAPGSRRTGWNMEMSYFYPEIFAEGITIGDKNFKYLKLYKNGLMEFWTPLGDHFCWRQDPEEYRARPRLYPYPIVEYLITFLRLYKAISDKFNYQGPFLLSQHYVNSKGYILLPYRPGVMGFDFASTDEVDPNNEDHIAITNQEILFDFDSNAVAYEILTIFYSVFGYSPDKIPFYSSEESAFIIE